MANFNFNKVILGGRLTADPELKTTPSGIPVTSFTVAVNRRSKSEDAQADFLNVTAWRQTAEFVTRYFRKGSSICVVGSIQTRSWTDQSGQKRFATEIVADEAFFVDAKSESPLAVREAAAAGFQNTPAQSPSYVPEGYSNFGNQNASGSAQSYQNQNAPKFEDLSDDEELPF
ncbi:MAG: single-stranded DNA-binding protein [Clostridia bacterium]|jgi:single-strand DNA-binding protein|nr:single-stranded DNA-binding protein [Clostridia bacterium]MBQ4194067.1 single-stranded DNA-binding protein [Clostridia bacterium]